jgi:dihydroxyacetone kinase
MGIHNEPGTSKLTLPTTAELVSEMLSKITDTEDKERSFVPFKNDGSDEVVLLVNNLGSISELEFGAISHEGKSECSGTD